MKKELKPRPRLNIILVKKLLISAIYYPKNQAYILVFDKRDEKPPKQLYLGYVMLDSISWTAPDFAYGVVPAKFYTEINAIIDMCYDELLLPEAVAVKKEPVAIDRICATTLNNEIANLRVVNVKENTRGTKKQTT